MHVQSVQNYCFSLSNMQICDILVAVILDKKMLSKQCKGKISHNSKIIKSGFITNQNISSYLILGKAWEQEGSHRQPSGIHRIGRQKGVPSV